MSIDWKRFAQVVREHQRFVLTSHVRPDCDALGSELGMAGLLDQLGKDVLIVNGQETPPNLRFIDPDRRIRAIGHDIQAADLAQAEVVMILDTSAWVQLGPMAEVVQSLPAKRMVLDHHMSEDALGAELFKNVRAEATGRLVVEAADALQVPLTPTIATPLFAALATDTGWFRFGSTSAETYQFASRLTQAGASPSAIYRDLYEQDSLGRVRLRGVILERTQVEMDGKLAHTYVLRSDFERTGAHASDTEDAINMTLAIVGVEFAVILVEQSSGGFKVSFRSRCKVDCSALAAKFNGGGHRAAAGAHIAGSLAEAQAAILRATRAAMSEQAK